jgi:Protein of unknown function (DUF2721)
MPTSSVVTILTASIAPVIVISGVGLVLLSITNRYGRAIDRARALMDELEHSDPSSARVKHLEEQLRHTHQRARLLRASMTYASASIFFVSLMVVSLFLEQVLTLQRDFVALPLFALCLLCLVASMYYSIRDITVSLGALELRIESVGRTRAVGPGQ